MLFELDESRQRFLRDHRVGEGALLCTVMGLECLAVAAGLLHPDSTGTVHDLRVLAPLVLPPSGLGRVAVRSDGRRLRVLSGEADGSEYFTASLGSARGRPRPHGAVPSAPPGCPAVSAAVLYDLFFHGPSFRVLHSAYWTGSVMVGVLATGLPPIGTPPGPSLTAPLLLELCLQTAGAYEVGASGRMMIPASIELVERFSGVESYDRTELWALVEPRHDLAGSVFDALVVDAAGGVHLRVTGYRTAPFPHPVDPVTVAPVARALAGIRTGPPARASTLRLRTPVDRQPTSP